MTDYDDNEDFEDNEEFDDNFDDNDAEGYNDNSSDSELPWGMILLAALGGLAVYGVIKKSKTAVEASSVAPAIAQEACVQIGPDRLPEFVEKGWQIYSASNSSTGGALWACPPGVTPPNGG